MSNSVKYSTSIPSNSLQKGDVAIGVNSVDMGPTSTTGWYNGLLPTGNYLIYKTSTSNIPLIISPQSDDELYRFVIEEGGNSSNTTSVSEALRYIAGQSDLFAINQSLPNIVTDGLQLNLSAGLISSYPTLGGTWYDICGMDNDGTLTNTPTFDSNGWVEFDGADDYIDLGSPSSLTLNNGGTITALCKWNSYNGSSWSNTIIGKGGSSWGNHHYILFKRDGTNKILFSVSNGSSYLGTTGPFTRDIPLNQWFYVTATWDGTVKKIYYNGNLEMSVSSTIMPISSTAPVSIGRTGTNGYYLDGGVNSLDLYNRALTQDEILTNYYQGAIITDELQQFYDFNNLICYGGDDGLATGNIKNMAVGQESAAISNINNGISFNRTQGYMEWDGTTTANINIPNTGQMPLFTLSAWVYNLQGGNGRHSILTNYWEIVGTSLQFWSYDFDNTYWRSSPNGSVPYNEWTHITTTWDGSKIRHYIDGELVYTQPSSSGGTSQSLSKIAGYSGRNFYGRIGILSIYEKCLNASEISQNFLAHNSRFK